LSVVRLFVALDLPEGARRALGELIERLSSECRRSRWVRPEGMHITLKFIGHGDGTMLDSIDAALATVRLPEAVEMRFRGLGFFPNERRPRVAWCGVEASANLVQLAAEVERRLEPLGIAPESRPFVPHLTLARFQSTEELNALLRAATELGSRDFGSGRQTEFHLFESVLKRSGAEYRRLQTYRFQKEAA
jgi:2'-5' RNA ligase